MPRHSTSKPATYDIITVRWKEDQYKIWRHWVDKTCPTANVHWIPDTKPYPKCWSGGKLPCFNYRFDTNRVIYMDTDTIVTQDLEQVFDLMEDCKVGVSYSIPRPFNQMVQQYAKQIETINKVVRYKFPPKSVSSGMVVTVEPDALYKAWAGTMEDPLIMELFAGDHLFDEHALSLTLSQLYERNEVWDTPLEIHGNICHGKHFGNCKTPWVIHYHQANRLIIHRLGGYLNV